MPKSKNTNSNAIPKTESIVTAEYLDSLRSRLSELRNGPDFSFKRQQEMQLIEAIERAEKALRPSPEFVFFLPAPIMLQERYLLFKPHRGFAVYNPDNGSIRYTQEVPEASEASKDDWSDVLGCELVSHVFVPAEIWVHNLKQEIVRLQSSSRP